MEVILMEKIANLGNIGDRVKVRPGYGRNFLLPQGKAMFEARRAELEQKQAGELASARERVARIEQLRLRLTAKAGSEGKLFGSLGTVDIAEACTAAGVPVARSEVRLPGGPIRVLGEHHVELHLHADVTASVTIEVVAEDAAAT